MRIFLHKAGADLTVIRTQIADDPIQCSAITYSMYFIPWVCQMLLDVRAYQVFAGLDGE